VFVRKKVTSSGAVKHYLVESRREGGKVRQKVLFYLGDHATPEAALKWLDAEADRNLRPWNVARAAVIANLDGVGSDEPIRPVPGTENDRAFELLRLGYLDGCRYADQAAQLREILRSAQSD
jgi:hypothetical protein